jgi:predicted Zn-dependent peptidase
MAMNSNDRIAGALAPYVSLERTPETLNRSSTPTRRSRAEDIRDAAKKYFREESRTVVTLSTKGQNIASLGRRERRGRMMRRTLTPHSRVPLHARPLSSAAQEETKPAPGSEPRAGSRATATGEDAAATKMPKTSKPATVLEQTQSPLVSFRLLFMTGSASDPRARRAWPP